MDTFLWTLTALFFVLLAMNWLDGNENFVVYHPQEYERINKMPCYRESRNFGCVNNLVDMDLREYNVCSTPNNNCGAGTCHKGSTRYVMSKSIGRPRTCRRLY